MGDRETLYNPTININDDDVKFKPNSVDFTEGQPVSKVRARSGGGGAVDTVYSEDIETAYSIVKFTLYTTRDLVEISRIWKSNKNRNTITLTDSDDFGDELLSRTFKHAAMVTDPPKKASADGEFEVEFHSDPAQ
jgi:hypothetical protein